MKKIVLSLAIIIISLTSYAQKELSKVKFNVGGELGFATGNLNGTYSIGIGATAQLEYALDEKSHITVNSGIIEYVGKKIPNTSTKNQSNAVIPILAGVKYNFATNFYGSAQLGVSLFTGKVGATKFTYAPGLGFKINDKWDALLKYTGYSDAGGAFGIRVAYSL
jgi:Outer membrane protein beta-barrel domain